MTDPVPPNQRNVYLWDVEKGQLLQVLKHGYMAGVEFTPNGRRLVSINLNGDLKEFDLASGDELVHINNPIDEENFRSLAVTPDGRAAVIGTEKSNLVYVFRLPD